MPKTRNTRQVSVSNCNQTTSELVHQGPAVRKPKPADAPVPSPDLSDLPYQEKGVNWRRGYQASYLRWVRNCERRAHTWLSSAPSYILPNVNLSLLEERSKNIESDLKKAKIAIQEMQDWPADACSGRWYDQNEGLGFRLGLGFRV
jgi:hypothetical protein